MQVGQQLRIGGLPDRALGLQRGLPGTGILNLPRAVGLGDRVVQLPHFVLAVFDLGLQILDLGQHEITIGRHLRIGAGRTLQDELPGNLVGQHRRALRIGIEHGDLEQLRAGDHAAGYHSLEHAPVPGQPQRFQGAFQHRLAAHQVGVALRQHLAGIEFGRVRVGVLQCLPDHQGRAGLVGRRDGARAEVTRYGGDDDAGDNEPPPLEQCIGVLPKFHN